MKHNQIKLLQLPDGLFFSRFLFSSWAGFSENSPLGAIRKFGGT
jgi:hypothetical protein